MKEILLSILDQIQEDATFFVYLFNEDGSGTFKSGFKPKPFVLELIEKSTNISPSKKYDDVALFEGTNYGVSLRDFSHNIDYKTENTEGFMNYVSKYNPYYNIFIKVDEENKTITFKLGDKEKTLQLIEKTGYVSKPHYKKYMKIVSVEDLKEHIADEFWNPRMVDVGRLVLGIKDFTVSSLLALA